MSLHYSTAGIFFFFTTLLWSQDIAHRQTDVVYDYALFNSETELANYKGFVYMAFREGTGPDAADGGADGKIRIQRSRNGKKWENIGFVFKLGWDLHHPVMSELPSGKLAVSCTGYDYSRGKIVTRKNFVFFSDNGILFEDAEDVKIFNGDILEFRLLDIVSTKQTPAGVFIREVESGRVFRGETSDFITYEVSPLLSWRGAETVQSLDQDEGLLHYVRHGDKIIAYHSSDPAQPVTEVVRPGVEDFLLLRHKGADYIFENSSGSLTLKKREGDNFRDIFTTESGEQSGDLSMAIHRRDLVLSWFSDHDGTVSVYISLFKLN